MVFRRRNASVPVAVVLHGTTPSSSHSAHLRTLAVAHRTSSYDVVADRTVRCEAPVAELVLADPESWKGRLDSEEAVDAHHEGVAGLLIQRYHVLVHSDEWYHQKTGLDEVACVEADLQTRECFADLGASILEAHGMTEHFEAQSHAGEGHPADYPVSEVEVGRGWSYSEHEWTVIVALAERGHSASSDWNQPQRSESAPMRLSYAGFLRDKRGLSASSDWNLPQRSESAPKR